MPRVNFYQLSHNHEQASAQLACRLAEKLCKQGLAVHMLADSEASARELDRLLWSFTPESFVPHALATQAHETTAVVIGWDPASATAGNLLNLTSAIPPGHASLDTIAEFVENLDEARALSRQKWNQYKQFGYELQHHKL